MDYSRLTQIHGNALSLGCILTSSIRNKNAIVLSFAVIVALIVALWGVYLASSGVHIVLAIVVCGGLWCLLAPLQYFKHEKNILEQVTVFLSELNTLVSGSVNALGSQDECDVKTHALAIRLERMKGAIL